MLYVNELLVEKLHVRNLGVWKSCWWKSCAWTIWCVACHAKDRGITGAQTDQAPHKSQPSAVSATVTSMSRLPQRSDSTEVARGTRKTGAQGDEARHHSPSAACATQVASMSRSAMPATCMTAVGQAPRATNRATTWAQCRTFILPCRSSVDVWQSCVWQSCAWQRCLCVSVCVFVRVCIYIYIIDVCVCMWVCTTWIDV